MGTTFTALMLQKSRTNYQYTLHHLGKLLEAEGYLPEPDPEKAEVSFSQYLFGRQRWQMVTGNMELLARLAEKIAKKNKAEALFISCCDSDFVETVLFDPLEGTRTRARSGVSYDGSDPPQVEQELWQKASQGKEPIDFAGIFGRHHVFAEDMLEELGEALGFDGAAAVMSACGEGGEPEGTVYFGRKDLPPKRITEGLPLLEKNMYYDKPVPVGEPYQWSFINRGGPWKGLELLIYGPFAQDERMTFEDVHLTARLHPEEKGEEWVRFEPEGPIRKVQLTNGWYAYKYIFPELPLHPGLNREYEQIHPDYGLSAAVQVYVHVTAAGDARFGLDVYFSAVPLNCPERGRGLAWTICGVEYHKEWIEEHNAWNEQHGGMPELMFRLEDFEY